jgi:hypothetical protein
MRNGEKEPIDRAFFFFLKSRFFAYWSYCLLKNIEFFVLKLKKTTNIFSFQCFAAIKNYYNYIAVN